MRIFQFLSVIIATSVLLTPQSTIADHSSYSFPACTKTAKVLKSACGFDVRDNYLQSAASCLNFVDGDNRKECFQEAFSEKKESSKLCRVVFNARKDLCNEIGEAPYDPPFGEEHADNFVNPLEIGNSIDPNPYFPLVPGNQWIYQGTVLDDEGEEVTETITVTVTDKTKLIDGVTCIVINDLVVEGEDDTPIEDTDDWYAQDSAGNVWYCGEISENFELFEGDNPEDAELVDIDGSWKAGRDGAKAGILFPAIPQVGDIIRQEVAWGEAEDVIEILSLTGNESTEPASCLDNCLVTRDFTPLDPEANENKYYVPGIGFIVEINLENGERLELIEFSTP